MKATLAVVFTLALSAAARGEEGLPVSCQQARDLAAHMTREQLQQAKQQYPDKIAAARRCGVRV